MFRTIQASETGAGLIVGQAVVQSQLFASTGLVKLAGALTFRIVEQVSAGTYVLSGSKTAGAPSLAASSGHISLSFNPAVFSIGQVSAPGTFTINGTAPTNTIIALASSGAFAVTDIAAKFERSGDNYETQQGGIGHYLEELERARGFPNHTQDAGADRPDNSANVQANSRISANRANNRSTDNSKSTHGGAIRDRTSSYEATAEGRSLSSARLFNPGNRRVRARRSALLLPAARQKV